MRMRERSPFPRLLRRSHAIVYFLRLAAILCLVASPAPAQDNEACFNCHADAELTGSWRGEEISVFVDQETKNSREYADRNTGENN